MWSIGVSSITSSSVWCCAKYPTPNLGARRIVPLCTSIRPAISLASVLFPFPFDPSSATRSSMSRLRLIPDSTVRSSYPIDTRSSVRIGAASRFGAGKSNFVGASSTTDSNTGSFSSALIRLCACRAFVAFERNRSTNDCMCARCAAIRSAIRDCCIACSVLIRTNSS